MELFTTTKILNRRQARWAQELAGYDFKIYFRPGKKNAKADYLSRRPEFGREEGGDGKPPEPILKQYMLSNRDSLAPASPDLAPTSQQPPRPSPTRPPFHPLLTISYLCPPLPVARFSLTLASLRPYPACLYLCQPPPAPFESPLLDDPSEHLSTLGPRRILRNLFPNPPRLETRNQSETITATSRSTMPCTLCNTPHSPANCGVQGRLEGIRRHLILPGPRRL